MIKSDSDQIVIKGISGSPGICIGKAYLVDREGVNVIKRYPIDKRLIPAEIDRFKTAVSKAKKEYAAIIESLDQDLGANLDILETHMVLFKDKMLYGKTIETITSEQINAEWALRTVSTRIQGMFAQVDDHYLKSRVNDIVQVSDKIMSHLTGAQDIQISKINKRVILVANDLSPADASQIQLERIKGFVTERGGKDSHTAIIAKSLNIPAVFGLENVMIYVKNDDILIVDGSSGVLIINPDEDTLFSYEERRVRFVEYHAGIQRESHLPATTLDGVTFNLLANIELIEEVVSVKDNKAGGIGLFRTEYLYLDLKRFPTEEELFTRYMELVELMNGHPVTIRTLDINGDKVNPNLYYAEEANPVLGLRAVRFCLENQDVFITQIKAILRAGAFGNIKLLIPMISCVDELIRVKQVINRAVDELTRESKVFDGNIPLGIMIEVPSAVIMAEKLAEYVDFFSIGTNDLIQYSLAIDRKNRKVAHLYQPLDPAVLKLIRMTMDAADKKKIGLAMCGEMAGDPINIPVLVGMGLRELSMNPGSIPVVKQIIRKIDSKKARKDLEYILTLNSAAESTAYIKEQYRKILPDAEAGTTS